MRNECEQQQEAKTSNREVCGEEETRQTAVSSCRSSATTLSETTLARRGHNTCHCTLVIAKRVGQCAAMENGAKIIRRTRSCRRRTTMASLWPRLATRYARESRRRAQLAFLCFLPQLLARRLFLGVTAALHYARLARLATQVARLRAICKSQATRVARILACASTML